MDPKICYMNKISYLRIRKFISIAILVAFVSTSIKSPAYAQVVDPLPRMPMPGVMVHLSPEFTPAYLKGIVIHPENALNYSLTFGPAPKDCRIHSLAPSVPPH